MVIVLVKWLHHTKRKTEFRHTCSTPWGLCYTYCTTSREQAVHFTTQHPRTANCAAGKHPQTNGSHMSLRKEGRGGHWKEVHKSALPLSLGRYVSQSTMAKLQWSTMLQRLTPARIFRSPAWLWDTQGCIREGLQQEDNREDRQVQREKSLEHPLSG